MSALSNLLYSDVWSIQLLKVLNAKGITKSIFTITLNCDFSFLTSLEGEGEIHATVFLCPSLPRASVNPAPL